MSAASCAGAHYDRRVTDRSAPTTTLPWGLRASDVAVAAATGVLTLPDPARLGPLGRFALRTATAGTVGAGLWAELRHDPRLEWDLVGRTAFAAGAAGVVHGAAELGWAMDAALQRRLVGLGVRRPRVAMALAGVDGGALGRST